MITDGLIKVRTFPLLAFEHEIADPELDAVEAGVIPKDLDSVYDIGAC